MDTEDFTGQYAAWCERRAWQLVVDQFRKLGIDINQAQYNPLIRSIEAWGELLVELRMTQSETEREVIRQERLALALRVVHQ